MSLLRRTKFNFRATTLGEFYLLSRSWSDSESCGGNILVREKEMETLCTGVNGSTTAKYVDVVSHMNQSQSEIALKRIK